MSIESIAAVGAEFLAPAWASRLSPAASSSFSDLIMQGVQQVDRTIRSADAQAAAFAVDDSIPIHQVTLALEQARMSLQLMLQVRARLVEGYQETMRMQL